MIRLSNKGQSLVLFVVFIPVFLIIGVTVVDLSYAKYQEVKLDNINKLIINYGLKHIDDDPYNEMVNLINKNDSKIEGYDIEIDSSNKTITSTLNKSTNGFFGSIINKKIFKEKSCFKGYIKDNKKIIEKGE